MAGVSTLYLFYLGFFIVSLTEDFLFSFLVMIRFKSKLLFKKKQSFLGKNTLGYSSNVFLFVSSILSLCSLRISKRLWVVPFDLIVLEYVFIVFVCLLLRSFWTDGWGRQTSSGYDNLTALLWVVILLLNTTTNLLVFVLLVECIAALYYYFFLQQNPRGELSIIRYKNLLSLYLWLSFFTLFFFIVACLWFVAYCGSLSFYELRWFGELSGPVSLLLIALFWKVGMPGFHFFKFEIYRYLPIREVVLFSSLSLLFNFLILLFFLYALLPLFTGLYVYLFIVLSVNIILLVAGLEKLNLFVFLALSGINTWSIFALIFFS